MTRPRAALLPGVLAGACALVLGGLAVPAQAMPPAADRHAHAAEQHAHEEECLEPASNAKRGHGWTKGQAGRARSLDHRAVSVAEQKAIEKRTEAILAEQPAAGSVGGAGVTIPVHVHVMAAADGTGDVTDQQVADQIAVLDRGFAGQESPDAADAGFDFELAGLHRYYNDKWHLDKQSKKYRAETRKGGPGTLNIWLVEFGYLGVAHFPWDTSNAAVDGIRVLWSSLPGGTETNYNAGDTAVHEVGHWLGLYHTFEGGCGGVGDHVADTPAQSVATNGCPEGQDSCPDEPGLDPVHNYMDYSYDSCYNQFTPDQAVRMQEMWSAYRAS